MARQIRTSELDQLELFTPDKSIIGGDLLLPASGNVNASLKSSAQTAFERKKRLGQYFSGAKVARLLAGLANTGEARSILDPMAGSGDMLLAAAELPTPISSGKSGSEVTLGAIEIDPSAYEICRTRLEGHVTPSSVPHHRFNQELICGSAFDPSSWGKWRDRAWDVVITNPPYVRYQNQSAHRETNLEVPSREETKEGLISVLRSFTFLPENERHLILRLAEAYSGLSDLAVPSWLLCAASVRPDGVLAMVLPESWMNREYAFLVHYLLLRWFDIEVIVEDTHAIWFDEAQVKTNLLIARRIPQRSLPTGNDEASQRGYAYCRLTRSCADNKSLVGGIYEDEDTEGNVTQFVHDLRTWRGKRGTKGEGDLASRVEARGGSLEWRPLHRDASHLKNVLSDKRWFTEVEKFDQQSKCFGASVANSFEPDHTLLPIALREELSRFSVDQAEDWMTFKEMGVEIGQGHRTGANLFFHADLVRLDGNDVVVRGADRLGGAILRLPRDCALPVLRKQSELPLPFVVDEEALTGRVLTLHRFALPEDRITSPLAQKRYLPFPKDLAEYVAGVARLNVGTADVPRFVPALSAVAPNSRSGSEGIAPQFWYHLPDYAPRHRPDLLVARINHRSPRFYWNRDRGALIDANFSTLWRSTEVDLVPSLEAVLALCNSTWAAVFLESTGAVFGGGALKVEAAHLRRVVFPVPAANERAKFWDVMDECGRRLINAHREQETELVIQQIDEQVGTALSAKATSKKQKRSSVKDNVQSLRALHQNQLARRCRRPPRTYPSNDLDSSVNAYFASSRADRVSLN